MDSNILTLLSIFLPLSSMWASSTTDGAPAPSPKSKVRQKLLDSYASGSTGKTGTRKPSHGSLSSAGNTKTPSGDSPLSSPSDSSYQDGIMDLEAQNLASIRVAGTLGAARYNGIL